MKYLKKLQGHFRLKVMAILLLLLAICVYSLQNKIAFLIFIDGSSMSPTYSDKELVWATSLQSEYQKDDVVVVKLDNKLVVKRIKFVSGDVFWVLKDDKLHWTPIPDNMVEDFKNINIWEIKKLTVPNKMFWLEGDNKLTSYDSRICGFFSKEQIIGVLCVSRFNTNNYDISAPIVRMQNLKEKGESVTMEKFITNVFKP